MLKKKVQSRKFSNSLKTCKLIPSSNIYESYRFNVWSILSADQTFPVKWEIKSAYTLKIPA